MNSGMVIVGMADYNAVRHPGVLTTLGLGSCVGIALYDKISRIGGLAHIMLPDSKQIKNNRNPGKFADTAIMELLAMMVTMGAKREQIFAKIAGGAQMFAVESTNYTMRIGDRNIEAVMEILKNNRIPLVGSDTGRNYGRTIELYTDDGRLVIKTVAQGVRTI